MEVPIVHDRRRDEDQQVLLVAALALVAESESGEGDVAQNGHLDVFLDEFVIAVAEFAKNVFSVEAFDSNFPMSPRMHVRLTVRVPDRVAPPGGVTKVEIEKIEFLDRDGAAIKTVE